MLVPNSSESTGRFHPSVFRAEGLEMFQSHSAPHGPPADRMLRDVSGGLQAACVCSDGPLYRKYHEQMKNDSCSTNSVIEA